MTRGKHGRRAERRRAEMASAELEALARSLIDEFERAEAADTRAAAYDAAAQRLATLETARDAAVADEVERLGAVMEELRAAVEAEERLADGIDAAWKQVTATLAAAYGGGLEGGKR